MATPVDRQKSRSPIDTTTKPVKFPCEAISDVSDDDTWTNDSCYEDDASVGSDLSDTEVLTEYAFEDCAHPAWWAITSLEKNTTALKMYKQIEYANIADYFIISARCFKCPAAYKQAHFHIQIKFKKRKSLRQVEDLLLLKPPDWARPVNCYYPAHSFITANKLYHRYIVKKGSYREYGESGFNWNIKPTGKKTKTEMIIDDIRSGERVSSVIKKYPTMIDKIRKFAEFRPHRKWETKCLYVWGDTGVGKTQSVKMVLDQLQDMGACSRFYKPIGVSKWWNGYDNQDIVVMDDPVLGRGSGDSRQLFLHCINPDDCQVEIKGGMCNFDAKLLIIITNYSVGQFCECFEEVHRDAIRRRITGDALPYHLQERELAKQFQAYLLTFLMQIELITKEEAERVVPKEIIKKKQFMSKHQFNATAFEPDHPWADLYKKFLD